MGHTTFTDSWCYAAHEGKYKTEATWHQWAKAQQIVTSVTIICCGFRSVKKADRSTYGYSLEFYMKAVRH